MDILRVALVFLLFSSGVAQASLVGMVYDDHHNITWLGDGNYALTSGYVTSEGRNVSETDGMMTWGEAVEWADQLTVGGFDNWRLWSAFESDGSGPCVGYNCNGSELGNLFYTKLNANAGNPISSGNPDLLELFSNVKDSMYWSESESGANPGNAWSFNTTNGFQSNGNKYTAFYAWAVHPGNVTSVPVPSPGWLISSALVMFTGFRCRRDS